MKHYDAEGNLTQVESGCDTTNLQQMISEEFPAERYHGKVMIESHDSFVYEAETDNLDATLAGKTWKELDSSFVTTNHDEYVLMNGSAVVAFLGAWLWRAAEALDAQNQVRSSLIFQLATYGGFQADGSGLWGRSLKSLNQRQRNVIRLLLECATETAKEGELNLMDRALKSVINNPYTTS
ncbi:MAG TPA: hypothetical protein VHX11_13065 [Acidobacteriaceae bacterium]|nr:hypothetical protein [Acidobacteriaceae bacterium]